VSLCLGVFVLSQLQCPDTMVFAVADVDGVALDEDAVRPREFARERITVRPVTALAGTDNGGDCSLFQINSPDDVILRVGNVQASVGGIGDALRTVQRIARRAELRRQRRAPIAGIT